MRNSDDQQNVIKPKFGKQSRPNPILDQVSKPTDATDRFERKRRQAILDKPVDDRARQFLFDSIGKWGRYIDSIDYARLRMDNEEWKAIAEDRQVAFASLMRVIEAGLKIKSARIVPYRQVNRPEGASLDIPKEQYKTLTEAARTANDTKILRALFRRESPWMGDGGEYTLIVDMEQHKITWQQLKDFMERRGQEHGLTLLPALPDHFRVSISSGAVLGRMIDKVETEIAEQNRDGFGR